MAIEELFNWEMCDRVTRQQGLFGDTTRTEVPCYLANADEVLLQDIPLNGGPAELFLSFYAEGNAAASVRVVDLLTHLKNHHPEIWQQVQEAPDLRATAALTDSREPEPVKILKGPLPENP